MLAFHNFHWIAAAGIEQGPNFGSPLIEEGRACLLGLRYAKDVGITDIIAEGDRLTLINLLQFSKV